MSSNGQVIPYLVAAGWRLDGHVLHDMQLDADVI